MDYYEKDRFERELRYRDAVNFGSRIDRMIVTAYFAHGRDLSITAKQFRLSQQEIAHIIEGAPFMRTRRPNGKG